MKNVHPLFFIFFVVVSQVFSQSYKTQWVKTYGGTKDECGQTVYQTTDEGYIIAGYIKSFGAGESDAWLLKTNAHGDTIWTKVFGGEKWDWGQSGLQTDDGGYLLIVRCYSFGAGNYDAWIIKTDAYGDTVWTKLLGGELDEWLTSVQPTKDRRYIFAGRTSSFEAKGQDFWVVKTDSLGEILWMKTYGGKLDETASFIQQTDDMGFIIIGRTYSYGAGNSDIWLIKTDSEGDTLWTKSFGGIDADYGVSVRQTNDGGYIMVGDTQSQGAGETDIWLIKTNAFGDSLWTRTFGGPQVDRAFGLLQSSNGNYLIGGYTNSFGAGSFDGWLIETDNNGDLLCSQTFGTAENDGIMDVQETVDGGFVITGYTSEQEGNSDLWLMKIFRSTPVSVKGQVIPTSFELHQNHPNPFNSKTIISYNIPRDGQVRLSLFNVLGEKIKNLIDNYIQAGSYECELDMSSFTSGLYFISLKFEQSVLTIKLNLIK